MTPKQIRDHVAASCGYNKAWTFEEAQEYWRIRDSHTDAINKAQQGEVEQYWERKAIEADQALTAHKERTSHCCENCTEIDERAFDGEDAEEWMRRSEQQGE